MTYTAHYTDAEHSTVSRSDMPVSIPADPANRHYAEIIEAGVTIADYVAPSPPSREEWRETASLPRADFVNAAADAGLLTDDEAIEAAKGGWPASFDAALTSLDTAGKRRAKVLWASVIDIQRNADLIALIIASTIPITATQVDTLFGYAG